MTKEGWAVVALGVVVLFIVGVIIFSRRSSGKQRTEAKIKGPFGISAAVATSSDVTPGVRAHNLISREGGLKAEDGTGRGIDAQDVDTRSDITLTNTPHDPKV